MGRLIVIQFITIDGVVEDPDGADETPFGGWAMRQGPEGVAGDKFKLGDLMTSGVLLFGRRTWDHFSTRWPPRDSPFALLMNNADKGVVTDREIDLSVWSHSVVVDHLTEWVAETLPRRDIVVIGSGSLVEQLAALDLVDEYRLLTFPDVVGSGRKLFPAPRQLTLTSSEQVGPATLAIYAVNRG